MILNIDKLQEFAKRGEAAQQAVDAMIRAAQKCPYCSQPFLPQSWNQRFCSYEHRYLYRARKKRISRLQ